MVPIKDKTYPKLRIFMHMNGITQTMIAQWLNVSRQTVSLKLKKINFSENDKVIILGHLLKYDVSVTTEIFA